MQSQIPNGPSTLEPKKVKRMLDLCSGFGGASEAFVEAGWQVVRIESNPALEHIPHTRIADVMDYRPAGAADIDLVWASPPCPSQTFLSGVGCRFSIRGDYSELTPLWVVIIFYQNLNNLFRCRPFLQ